MNGESGEQRAATISVIDPLSRAMEWSRDVLFRPFDATKWFVLGFCAWLARLGQGASGPNGSSGSNRWSEGGDRGDFEHGVREAADWFLTHLVPILVVASVVIVVVFAIWLVFLWLSSRGKFMFLDGVVNDRAAVAEPWRRFQAPADALFVFRIVLGLIGLGVLLCFFAFGAWLVWLGVAKHEPASALILVGVLGLIPFAAILVVFTLAELAINDFVVPLMYLRGHGVGAAWRELRELFAVRPGAFVLYVLVKMLIAFAVAAIGILTCCLTCCIVLLPYIGTVILLPVWVFLRAYPLYFLGQFGPEYARFATLGPEAEPPAETATNAHHGTEEL